MTLTRKIILTVAVTVMVFSAVNLLIVNRLLGATFGAFEDEEVSRNANRVVQSIHATYERLGVVDWSIWTETYNFLLGDNDEFAASNLDPMSIANLGINFIALSSVNGDVVFARHMNLESNSDLPYDDSFLPAFVRNRTPVTGDGSNVIKRGIVATSHGPMYVASHPVLQDDGTGPAAGTMTMGLFLNERWREAAKAHTQVEFRLHDLRTNETPAYETGIIEKLRQFEHVPVKDSAYIRDFSLMGDMEGNDALLVEVITPRDINIQRQRVQFVGTGSLLASGLIILIVLTLALRRMVVNRLQGLTGHIASIKKTDEFRPSQFADVEDEIGVLARQFDTLMLDYKNADENWRLPSIVAKRSSHPVVFTNPAGVIVYANPAFKDLLRALSCTGSDCDLRQVFEAHGLTPEDFEDMMSKVTANQSWTIEFADFARESSGAEVRMLVTPVNSDDGDLANISVYYSDITETKSLERQLIQAKKLESVGQLAAGVAHEINTPTQYVTDNINFFNDMFKDMDKLFTDLQQLSDSDSGTVKSKAIKSALDDADVEYLREETPKAISDALDGVDRISKIVRAMKSFSHPGTEMSEVDINHAIESTVTVASNEWKYVANVTLDLAGEMPPVSCNASQINQAVLNIVVNAAHALADNATDGEEIGGEISISTTHHDGWAEIRIADNGPGIPESVKDRIFDPFFTTKEVGKGTGQGLSIAYDAIVNGHGGTLDVVSEAGAGACFVIRLPLEAEDKAA